MFFPEVHKGDKYTPSAQRENAINRRLNSINGFSEVPITKQVGSSDSSSGFKITIGDNGSINGVLQESSWYIHWSNLTMLSQGDITTLSDTIWCEKMESDDGYASLILVLFQTHTGDCITGYRRVSTNTIFSSSWLTSTLSCWDEFEFTSSSSNPCIDRPLALLCSVNLITGEISNKLCVSHITSPYYYGDFATMVIIDEGVLYRYTLGGTAYFGSQTISISPITVDYETAISSVVTIKFTYDNGLLDAELLNGSFSYLSDDTTYYMVLQADGEYYGGVNVTGRILP